MLELLRPPYGLCCDTGDYWAIAIEENLIYDLGVLSVVTDP